MLSSCLYSVLRCTLLTWPLLSLYCMHPIQSDNKPWRHFTWSAGGRSKSSGRMQWVAYRDQVVRLPHPYRALLSNIICRWIDQIQKNKNTRHCYRTYVTDDDRRRLSKCSRWRQVWSMTDTIRLWREKAAGTAGTCYIFLHFFTALHSATRSFWWASVRPSVRPSSVKCVNCDKMKAPSEKSSIMTNRKSPTSFPVSLRWTSYVAPNPQRGPQKGFFIFSV